MTAAREIEVPRGVEIPPRAAAKITTKFAEAERLRQEGNELVVVALEAMGLDTAVRDDGLVWNVRDQDGRLMATLGPRMMAFRLPTPEEKTS